MHILEVNLISPVNQTKQKVMNSSQLHIQSILMLKMNWPIEKIKIKCLAHLKESALISEKCFYAIPLEIVHYLSDKCTCILTDIVVIILVVCHLPQEKKEFCSDAYIIAVLI